MTTQVTVLVQGNKKCQVTVEVPDQQANTIVPEVLSPGQFKTVYIHGEQRVVVQEIGDFLT